MMNNQTSFTPDITDPRLQTRLARENRFSALIQEGRRRIREAEAEKAAAREVSRDAVPVSPPFLGSVQQQQQPNKSTFASSAAPSVNVQQPKQQKVSFGIAVLPPALQAGVDVQQLPSFGQQVFSPAAPKAIVKPPQQGKPRRSILQVTRRLLMLSCMLLAIVVPSCVAVYAIRGAFQHFSFPGVEGAASEAEDFADVASQRVAAAIFHNATAIADPASRMAAIVQHVTPSCLCVSPWKANELVRELTGEYLFISARDIELSDRLHGTLCVLEDNSEEDAGIKLLSEVATTLVNVYFACVGTALYGFMTMG